MLNAILLIFAVLATTALLGALMGLFAGSFAAAGWLVFQLLT